MNSEKPETKESVDFNIPDKTDTTIEEQNESGVANSNNVIEIESIEKGDYGSVVYFKDQEFAADQFSESTLFVADYPAPAENYSELIEELQYRNGIIVAGYAHGTRKGYRNEYLQPKTETSFQIEQVYFGDVSQEKITVLEKYSPIIDVDNPYVEYDGPQYSMLKDNEKVLLFLSPTSRDGVYFPIYYEIPLPKNYQNFDANAKKELLDFYRGNKDMYQNVQSSIQKEEVQLSGGAIENKYVFTESIYWSEQEISDEELLEKMNEHILVRLATEYKIKIWPENHIHFSSNQDRLSKKGIQVLSLPDN